MFAKKFLKLVEIQTKIASAIPFLLGTLYALYHFKSFNVLNFLIMFVSLLAFDMVTTALNNYFDYKRAVKKYGFNYESHNAIVKYNMSEKNVIAIIALLLLTAVSFGILLIFRTNILVFFIGGLSFLVGISYSFGPVPISRTPLGELLSGLFMGFVILFLSVYIHVYGSGILSIALENGILSVYMNIVELLAIFLLSIPTICCIANVMLANNICDIEDDIENKRYTLPIYIGREKALLLYKWLYYIVYIDLAVLLVSGLLPWICGIVLLTLIPVYKNIKVFYGMQTKKDTFVLTVKNFLLMCVPLVVLFGGYTLAVHLLGIG